MNKLSQTVSVKRLLRSSHQQGMALLEGLIAVLIFSIGILGAVGLQASMMRGATDTQYRAEANYLVQQRIGVLWTSQTLVGGADNRANLVEVNTPMASLPSGTRSTSLSAVTCKEPGVPAAPCIFTVTVTWKLPGTTTTHNVTTIARVTQG